jgi:hypothetical protein
MNFGWQVANVASPLTRNGMYRADASWVSDSPALEVPNKGVVFVAYADSPNVAALEALRNAYNNSKARLLHPQQPMIGGWDRNRFLKDYTDDRRPG